MVIDITPRIAIRLYKLRGEKGVNFEAACDETVSLGE
jgi:hypothetical protein